eukprot:scaffold4793_cov175-Amphora_coffeaeformis.AAC.9
MTLWSIPTHHYRRWGPWPAIAKQEEPTTIPLEEYQFSRLDSLPDGLFYALPRLVYHMDEPAVAALTQYYRRNIPANSDLLDICSSWVSHYPQEFPRTMKRISAMGINYIELACNDQLSDGDFHVVDLNQSPQFPYSDESFDIVTCARASVVRMSPCLATRRQGHD